MIDILFVLERARYRRRTRVLRGSRWNRRVPVSVGEYSDNRAWLEPGES